MPSHTHILRVTAVSCHHSILESLAQWNSPRTRGEAVLATKKIHDTPSELESNGCGVC